jgi:hypothetical protein
MYHPSSKKKELVSRVLTYGLMTVSIITLVAVALLYTLGYRFDTKERQLELSGLVQFASTPANAVVEIDGVRHAQASPTKETLAAGSHEFVMWREGYETWRKTVSIKEGTLTWLNYTRLVPKERTVEQVATLPSLAQALASPDKRFMATVPDASKPTLSFYNLTADAVAESSLTLPQEEISELVTAGVTHSFVIDQWDRGGRYLLVKHVYGDKTEWLVVDRQDSKLVVNVTRTFDVDMTNAVFADNSATLLYALVDGGVRKINLRDETVSAPLVSKVSEFKIYGDVIAYVHAPNETTGARQVGVLKDGGKAVTLYTASSAPQVPVYIALTHYFDSDYVVISDGAKVMAMSGDFPTTPADQTKLKTTSSFTFSSDVGTLQLSPSGRFIIAQNAGSYVGYDLERNELSPVAMLAGTSEPRPLEWLDDYNVWSDRSDVLTMREFDGANQHGINQVVSGFDATLSPNGRWMYSIGRHSDGQLQLQRVRMILP